VLYLTLFNSKVAIIPITLGLSEQLQWIQSKLRRTADDRESTGICHYPCRLFPDAKHLGPVVRKRVSANSGLNVDHGFRFSFLKAIPLPILRDNLKAAKVKLLRETYLREFTSLWIKSEM